ncbi:MAG TPA: cupredoxin domain-containing protein [Symbiobacteriaceae bacterium]
MRILISTAVAFTGAGLALVLGLLRRSRDEADHGVGMTVAMAVGMSTGYVAGMISGLFLPDAPGVSTAVGSLAGLAAGLLVGGSFGLPAILEGVMAGLMGGVMGAMIGLMLPGSAGSLVASGIGLVALVVSLVARVLRHPAVGGHHGGHDDMTMGPRAPVFLAAIVFLVVGAGSWFAAGPLIGRLPAGAAHRHAAPLPVVITAGDFSYHPDAVVVPVGTPVRLELVNGGTQEHDLTIPVLTYAAVSHLGRQTPQTGLHLHTTAGQHAVLEFVPLQTGEYEGYCTLPGHKDQGMRFRLSVTAG